MKKDFSFARYFNPFKSMSKNGSGIHRKEKLLGVLAWDSFINGTYIKAIHGELKTNKNKKNEQKQ